jgi:Mlc titration factor MtfA (ptsG expression regulator)
MIWSFTKWRRNRVLRRFPLPDTTWRAAVVRLPLLRGLSAEELGRLRELATLFLHDKEIAPAAEVVLTDETRLLIAAQACLPILNLGIDWYRGWVSVIVYPDEFVPRHEYQDEAGVVHVTRDPMIGESWQRGPVILSASDAARSGECDGVNVVIHELAHKLDMLNGEPNGFPPLHPGMSAADWSRAFGEAYQDFCDRVDAGEDTEIDPYGAESPGEFFAVLSEAFFEIPHTVLGVYPEVYRQLAAFYRQDPARRMAQ